MIQKRLNTLLSLALALALVIEPVAMTLHAMHHVVRDVPVEFVAHNEADHASHTTVDQHHACGLCVQTKCADAIGAAVPNGACFEHESGRVFFVEHDAPSTRDASTAPSRAPPSLV